MKKYFILMLCFTVCACTSITEQKFTVATKETLKPGNALIFVERKHQGEASAHQVELTDNGEVIGLLGVGVGSKKRRKLHQLVWQRPAGEMSLRLTPSFMVKEAPPIVKVVEEGKYYSFIVGFKYSPYGLALEEQ